MSLEIDITAIKKMVEASPLFKAAGESEISNRHEPTSGPKIGEIAQVGSADQIQLMTDFEDRQIYDEDLLTLFSHLINTKQVWNLQGMYGRQARTLISNGWIAEDGKILKLPSIRPRAVAEAGLFKPAGEAERANRPQPVSPYRKITSVNQLRELAKYGVEVFVSSGAPLWEMHSFMYISHATDGTDEWMVDDYNSGRMYRNPQNTRVMSEMDKGRLWYDKDDFVRDHGHEEGFVEPANESLNEATPKKNPSLFKPAGEPELASREEMARAEAEARKKARAEQWAGTPDTELPWEEVARRELSLELDVDIEIDGDAFSGRGVVMRATTGKGNNGESEWMVFPNSEIAEEAAIERLENDLEYEPDIFGEGFLSSHITISDTDRHMIAQEEADYLVDEGYDEDQFLSDAGVDSDYQELQDQIDSLDTDAPDYEEQAAELERQKEVMLEAAKETVRENEYDKIYDLLEDPVEYFVNDRGIYTLDSLMKASFISIDIEEAAKDLIDTDGVARWLDGYDNEEVELPSGAVAFGTN